MRPDERVAALLSANRSADWNGPLGRIEVESVEQTGSSVLTVRLRASSFPTDAGGYRFINPPTAIRVGEAVVPNPVEAYRRIVSDAVGHYAARGTPGNTTTTVFSDISDGIVFGNNAVYLTARSNALGVNSTSATDSVGQRLVAAEFHCWESFYRFDTSSIPDTDTIDSVAFSLYGVNDFSTTDFTIEARLFDWGTSLTTGDYIAGANLGAQTLLATFNTTGWTNLAYNNFTSDAAFVSNINKTGDTRLFCSSSRMRLGTEPTGEERVQPRFADQAGTTEDPKLVVNHSAAGGAQVARRMLLGVGT